MPLILYYFSHYDYYCCSSETIQFTLLCYFSCLLLQFADLVERDPGIVSLFKYRSLTIFAPTNQAFQRYPDLKANVLYHIREYLYEFA